MKFKMGYSEFFVSQPNVFSGFQKSFEEADYVVLGVPFDGTSTYRTGARFGPNAIREASLNIETYSLRSGIDVEDLKIHDLGDLHVSMDVKETMERIRLVVKEILDKGKTPVLLGGEHTITFGAISGLSMEAQKSALLSFDAHLDLREEFMGLKLSHATFMRRIHEELKLGKIVEVGTRALSKEELIYANKAGIEFFTSQQIIKEGCESLTQKLREKLGEYNKTYISVDMDVLDPSYAPAVQNPEPEGLETQRLLDILERIIDNKIVCFDLVEVAPNYDNGVSAINAAKIIFEVLCRIEIVRRD
ncbi:MAG: agmatinase [Candidatus Bathyarchaeia archaeon]